MFYYTLFYIYYIYYQWNILFTFLAKTKIFIFFQLHLNISWSLWNHFCEMLYFTAEHYTHVALRCIVKLSYLNYFLSSVQTHILTWISFPPLFNKLDLVNCFCGHIMAPLGLWGGLLNCWRWSWWAFFILKIVKGTTLHRSVSFILINTSLPVIHIHFEKLCWIMMVHDSVVWMTQVHTSTTVCYSRRETQ